MAYDKPFYNLLRKDRDDKQRAKAFDEWLEVQSAPIQAACDYKVKKLTSRWGLSDVQAKAIISVLVIFMYMKPDEQLRWIDHGNHIRSEFEWAYPGMRIKEFLKEDVPA